MILDAETRLQRNMHTGHHAAVNRLKVAALARQLGFDPGEYAKPFPGMQIHNHEAPAPRPGLSTLAGIGIALASFAVPGAGLAGYLLANHLSKPAAELVEKVITKPGRDYEVNVDLTIDPPPAN